MTISGTFAPHNSLELWGGNELKFNFSEMNAEAVLGVRFMSAIRIPDHCKSGLLSPGLVPLEMRHVSDYKQRLPSSWARHGGVFLPMWTEESMWICLDNPYGYPFAVRVGAGKICAVTGKRWKRGLERSVRLKRDGSVKRTQNYLASPAQSWLDGFNTAKGKVRQFVAMTLGHGASVEEQLTGKGEVGGIQIEVFPMRPEVYLERYAHPLDYREQSQDMTIHVNYGLDHYEILGDEAEMGLAAGSEIAQQIESDEHDITDYEAKSSLRVFVHILNSGLWAGVTGEPLPPRPMSAAEYTQAGLPWYEFESTGHAAEGGALLSAVRPVNSIGGELPCANSALAPTRVVRISGSDRGRLGKGRS